MATLEHPFLILKARLVIALFLAISIGLSLVVGIFGALDLLPLQSEDPIIAPMLYSLIFSSLCLAILVGTRRPSLRLGWLLGRWPRPLAWSRFLILMGGVFLFSLGVFQLSYLGLALVTPSLVEATLQQSLILATKDTAYPNLYTAVILFSVLVVAPVTEEFIFRGVLLHRWGVKWGIKPAIVLTSILFGVLHSNLVGLFMFGVIMAVLYLSTRSLLVPILAHSINNGIASLIEFFTLQASTTLPTDALAEFRANWWIGVLCLGLSTPCIWVYLTRAWPNRQTQLPYFANQANNPMDTPIHVSGPAARG
jgi:membrane protease YdiL (CAAX protease family)